MNPALIIPILKLIADEAPAIIKLIADIKAGREPTEADWKEIEALANYSSKDAMGVTVDITNQSSGEVETHTRDNGNTVDVVIRSGK